MKRGVLYYSQTEREKEDPEEDKMKEKTVNYKGYIITVYKNRAGFFTATNDSGEPYMNIPLFRSEKEAIAWDKKNIDQMTESV